MSRPEPEALTARVLRGGAWMLALNATDRVLGAARVIVLARLLAPLDFGLFAAGLAAVSLLDSFSAAGTHVALIQGGERARALFDTAWTVGVVRGVALAGLLVGAAPAVAWFFAAPELAPMVWGLALVPLLRGLVNVGVVEFRGELVLARHYVLQASGAFADFAVAVGLALWRGDAWAFVGGAVASAAVRVCLSYLLHPYRPRARLDASQLRELLGYGRWVFASTAIAWCLADGVHAVVGRLVGVHLLGVYQLAWRVASIPTAAVTVASSVSLAAYAKLRDRLEWGRRGYLRVLAVVAVAAVPMAVGTALFAEDLVRVLLGSRWIDIVPSLRVLALASLVRSLAAPAVPLFQGLGRPELHTRASLVELGILAALLGPLTVELGLLGAATAVALAATGGAVASARAVSRLVGVTGRELTRVVSGPLVACVPIVVLRAVVPEAAGTLVGLGGLLLGCVLSYLACLLLLDRSRLYPLADVMPRALRWRLPRWV